MKRKRPLFSIIVPTYNRPKQLFICLQSLARLEYPKTGFEVVVIDDGSQISLNDITSTFVNQINITVLKQSNEGPASARNAGARQAKGRFLVFIDDDCTPTPQWLNAFEKAFYDSPVNMLGGKTLTAKNANLFSVTSQLIVSYLCFYDSSKFRRVQFFPSNNLAVAAKGFQMIGGFNRRFSHAAGEDRELCDRWLHHGYKIGYAVEAVVHHSNAMTLAGFLSQQFNYGRGAFRFHQISSRVNSSGKLKPLSFYLELIRYPFRQPNIRRRWLIATLIFISQSAHALGYILAMIHNKILEDQKYSP